MSTLNLKRSSAEHEKSFITSGQGSSAFSLNLNLLTTMSIKSIGGYKTFSMLNLAETKIYPADKC